MSAGPIGKASPTSSGKLPSPLLNGNVPQFGTYARAKLASLAINHEVPAWNLLNESVTRHGFWQLLSPAPVKPNQRLHLAMQVSRDFVLISLGFALTGTSAALLRGAFAEQFLAFVVWPLAGSLGPALLYGAIFTLIGYSEHLYHPETVREPRREMLVLSKAALLSTIITALGFAACGTKSLAVATLSAAPLSLMFQALTRLASRSWPHCERKKRNVLIVGAGPVGRRLARALEDDHAGDRLVCGFLDQKQLVAGDVLGRVEDIGTVARKVFADEIIIAVPPHSDSARRAIWEARRNHLDITVVPDLLGAEPAHIALETVGELRLLKLWEKPRPLLSLFLKRAADLVLAGTALVIAGPLLGGIAALIKLDSPGPIFYSALRLGFKGRRFLCCKFRTMACDADRLKEELREHNERNGAFFKMKDDPRITRVGRFLRKYSLDELPQLWNVLRGDMSLVGPRPHPLDDVEHYRLDDLQRLDVLPGLTGLWQVTARRDPSFERSMALDREYIAHWSLGMDFRLLCKTLGTVLRGEGM